MENIILGLHQLGRFIAEFLAKKPESYDENDQFFYSLLKRSEIENPWFTIENQRFALQHWSTLLEVDAIKDWLLGYTIKNQGKKVGLILAGNIPMVGFHDVISVVLTGNIPLIKMSSKDKRILPFLMEKWNDFSGGKLNYHLVEKLIGYDAVIATGSNNTARYLEYYFKDKPSIIRKNRTSIAVLSGNESDGELQNLSEDIFRYFGLGCRNVTRLFVPEDFKLDRLFENFVPFQEVINHHQYANNYDYNRAIYLLNQENFWDNNFVLLKEDMALFSPLAVLNFSRYKNINEVQDFIKNENANIQCVVRGKEISIGGLQLGEAQYPKLNTYADCVDTLAFLAAL